MNRKLRLGVLGLGEGRSAISAGLASPLWDVACLCDLAENLRRERCREFGVTRHTASYEEMLSDPSIDVIAIYTPDRLHADHVIQALKADKHVICTKPFISGLDQAQDVLKAWRASGRLVMVGQSSRFFEPMRRQRAHFESGELGELMTIEACYHADHRWFLQKPWAREPSFKWLYGGMSHPVDLVRWYLPRIDEVAGYAALSTNGRKGGLAHPDIFHYVLRAEDGRIARLSGAYSGPVVPEQRDSGMSCVLRCTDGCSQADYHNLRYAWRIGEQAVIESFEDRDGYYFRFEGHSHHAGEYQNYLEYFARCLARGEVPRPDAAEGIVTVALLEALEEAGATGRVVKLSELLGRYGLEALAGPAGVGAAAGS